MADPDVAPDAPSVLQPSGSVGATVFSGGFNAGAVGDSLSQTNIRLFTAEGVTPIWDKTFVATSEETGDGQFSVPIPALVRLGTAYEWDARTRAQNGLWSPRSDPLTSFTIPNAQPTLVLVPLTTYASLSGVKFMGTFSDPDVTDSLGALRIQLRVTTAPGHADWDTDTNLWDSGDCLPTAKERADGQFARVYGGKPLAAATYSWRAKTADDWGLWSDWEYGTITLSAEWNPDSGAIEFLTGYDDGLR